MSLPDWMQANLARGMVVIQPSSFSMPSGATLSGYQITLQSGITVPIISGTLADFSGATIDIISGLRGSFSSGLESPALSGLLSIQMSGAVSGRVLTSDTSGNASWQPAPAGSVPDPIDNSGAMIDILSGVRATFNSGVEAPSISGNLARFSGITSEIVSGLRGFFGSGLVTVALSGLLGFQMSGALSGRVVTSDNTGVGTWQTPPVGGGAGVAKESHITLIASATDVTF